MPLARDREEELPYVYVRDIQAGEARTSFIRLHKTVGPSKLVETFDAEAMVDVDHDGEIVSVTLFWRDDEGGGEIELVGVPPALPALV